MTSDQLLLEIQKNKLLPDPDITKIRREMLISDRSAEDIIFDNDLLNDEKVADLKSKLLKVPYRKIDFNAFDQQLIRVVPEETVRAYKVVPISRKDNVLIAGMVNPDDAKCQEAIKFVAQRARLTLGVYLISYSDWKRALEKYSPFHSKIEEAVQAMNLKSGARDNMIVELEATGTGGDAPIIRIVGDTFREAIRQGASDVHIEPQEKYLRVRVRVDGDLKEVASLPLEISQLVISRVKILASLKIDETRIPQDGRFRSKVMDKEVDFRVATFPTPLGEKVAVRVLDPSSGLKNFESLGLMGKNLELVKIGLEKPYGMVLVTGPTGSGKSTTLYSMLLSLNKEDVNILSLEDPIEYFVSGINQSQVRPEIGYDFASGLRQILRQDPDVIMVGEIRDAETAGLAVNAALTGHIVLSTLHTNNAAGVIPRLIDMKVEPFLLPSALNLIMAQRLVLRVCQKCKKAVIPPAGIQEAIANAVAGFPADLMSSYKPPYQVFKGEGCDACKQRGLIGRMALHEALLMNSTIENIINEGPTIQKIVAEAKRQGMVSMRQDGVLKALQGLVLIEEVLKETEEV